MAAVASVAFYTTNIYKFLACQNNRGTFWLYRTHSCEHSRNFQFGASFTFVMAYMRVGFISHPTPHSPLKNVSNSHLQQLTKFLHFRYHLSLKLVVLLVHVNLALNYRPQCTCPADCNGTVNYPPLFLPGGLRF